MRSSDLWGVPLNDDDDDDDDEIHHVCKNELTDEAESKPLYKACNTEMSAHRTNNKFYEILLSCQKYPNLHYGVNYY